MSKQNTAELQILSAKNAILEVARDWDGTNLNQIEESNRKLESSARQLARLSDEFSQNSPQVTEAMHLDALEIRAAIDRLTRMVDAGSAFVQGVAVYTGARSSTYNAHGASEVIRDPGAVRVL